MRDIDRGGHTIIHMSETGKISRRDAMKVAGAVLLSAIATKCVPGDLAPIGQGGTSVDNSPSAGGKVENASLSPYSAEIIGEVDQGLVNTIIDLTKEASDKAAANGESNVVAFTEKDIKGFSIEFTGLEMSADGTARENFAIAKNSKTGQETIIMEDPDRQEGIDVLLVDEFSDETGSYFRVYSQTDGSLKYAVSKDGSRLVVYPEERILQKMVSTDKANKKFIIELKSSNEGITNVDYQEIADRNKTNTNTETNKNTAEASAELPPLVEFDRNKRDQIPTFDVEEYYKKTRRVITPKDIINAKDSGQKYPSDVLLTSFGIKVNKDNSQSLVPVINTAISGTRELPYTYDVIRLKNADRIAPEAFKDVNSIEGVYSHDLLAIKMSIHVDGDKAIDLVMVTAFNYVNGENGTPDRSERIQELIGTLDLPATPLVENRVGADPSDLLGSKLAGLIWEQEKGKTRSVTKLMVNAKLSDPNVVKDIQNKLDGVWLIANGTLLSDVKVSK